MFTSELHFPILWVSPYKSRLRNCEVNCGMAGAAAAVGVSEHAEI